MGLWGGGGDPERRAHPSCFVEDCCRQDDGHGYFPFQVHQKGLQVPTARTLKQRHGVQHRGAQPTFPSKELTWSAWRYTLRVGLGTRGGPERSGRC